jgi:hypothetical protein
MPAISQLPLPLDSDGCHRCNHHRRAGAEDLVRADEVVDGNGAFFNLRVKTNEPL